MLLCGCTLHKPDFRALEFRALDSDPPTFQAAALGRQVQLIEPDDQNHPQEWRGPLRIVGACTANLSAVTAVYASRDVDYLLVVNHNGLTRLAHFVDWRSCRELWPPLRAEIPIAVTGDAIQIEPGQWLRLFNERAPIQ